MQYSRDKAARVQYGRNYRRLHNAEINMKNKIKTAYDPDYRLKKAKRHAKDRGLGFIVMFPNPFADNVKVDWHHIDDTRVVAIPRELHDLYSNCKYHREMVMDFIKQIYMQDEGVIQTG